MHSKNSETGLLAIVVSVALGSHGCIEAPDRADPGITFDTIAGVEHVITSGPGVWAEESDVWRIDESSGVVVGETEGDDAYVFGQISGVAVDPLGQIHVADPQALQIRVFSPEGEFLRQVGREGEGPGEFKHIGGLALAPDGVAALDGGLGRVTVFGLTGDVVRGSDGTVTDTAFLAEVRPDHVVVERNGMPYMSFPRPLAPRASFSFGPEGMSYLSRGNEYRIDVFSPSGDSLRTIRRPVEPRPVTVDQRDSALAVIADAFERVGENPAREVELPDRSPVISGLVPDSEGNLWVLNAGGGEGGRNEWSVHDASGRYLGAVLLPAMTVTQIGDDFLAGTTTDELGVPKAVVYRIIKSGR
jgi:hypothetical protein